MSAGISEAEFARRRRVHRSTVLRWGQAGRLVRFADGSVDELASARLIEQTRGTRDDVADRHAQERAARGQGAPKRDDRRGDGGGEASPDRHAAGGPQGPESDRFIATLDGARKLKAVSEARRVHALAEQEEMTRDRMRGNLVPREEVEVAMRTIGAGVRALLDVFPDQMAPVLAPVADIEEIHALLTDACRDVLTRLGETLARAKRDMAHETSEGAA